MTKTFAFASAECIVGNSRPSPHRAAALMGRYMVREDSLCRVTPIGGAWYEFLPQ